MILKRKIAKAKTLMLKKQKKVAFNSGTSIKVDPLHCHRSNELEPAQKYQETLKLKNVYKNFTRAICTFIISNISLPYLPKIALELGFEEKELKDYIKMKKEDIKGVIELRGLLIIQNNDNSKIIAFKKAFQRLAEIFIKYFAANWICCSKLEYKLDYLKFRFQFLKKIKNPSLLYPNQA